MVTRQEPLDSDADADAGLGVSVALVNALACARAGGAPVVPRDPTRALTGVLVVDPPSVGALRAADVPGFVALAEGLRAVFEVLDRGDVDAAASRLNGLLAEHPAHPHLAKDGDRWRLHHHPVDADLVPMWTAICAEALARHIGAGRADRLGVCAAPMCDRVFADVSRNGSRRFCSTTCQNRVKTAAFRLRRSG